MDTFETLDELWLDAASKITHEGVDEPSRIGGMREVLGYTARLSDPRACFMFNPIRRMSPSYAAAELLWYLSQTSDTTMLQKYAPKYMNYTEDGVNAWGAYGARWILDGRSEVTAVGANHPEAMTEEVQHHGQFQQPVGQIDLLLWLLRTKPETRHGVVVMWNAGDLPHAVAGDRKDLPCTLSLNFILRQGCLNCVATMRSNDVWLGLPNDVFCFASLQQIIAEALGVQCGWYQHQAMSLHRYDWNKDKFDAAAAPPGFKTGPLEHFQKVNIFRDEVAAAIRMEKWNRENGVIADHFAPAGWNSLLGQAVVMAASRWTDAKRTDKWLVSKMLQNYMMDF